MRELNFLNNLRKQGKLNLIEPSNEISVSYINKSNKCLKSAKILLKNELYENSISEAYYSMYDALIALLFKVGIKCENHSGAILILKLLFNEPLLSEEISLAKKERINKQYYVISKENLKLTKYSASNLIEKAENFILEIKLIIKNLQFEQIKEIRRNFEELK